MNTENGRFNQLLYVQTYSVQVHCKLHDNFALLYTYTNNLGLIDDINWVKFKICRTVMSVMKACHQIWKTRQLLMTELKGLDHLSLQRLSSKMFENCFT